MINSTKLLTIVSISVVVTLVANLIRITQSFTPSISQRIIASSNNNKQQNNNKFGLRNSNELSFSSLLPATKLLSKERKSRTASPTFLYNQQHKSVAEVVVEVEEEQQQLQQERVNIEEYNTIANEIRMNYLEEQAMYALRIAVQQYGPNSVFSNALIAGDVVITDLLYRMGYIQNSEKKLQQKNGVQVLFIDTFHLFSSTIDFLHNTIERKYNFTSTIVAAKDIPIGNKNEYDNVYGKDLWKTNIDQYDHISKVEPYQRGIKTLNATSIITGRTRWQGSERAYIDVFETSSNDNIVKINPLAYWTFEDVFNYIQKYKVPYHPLHEHGYPSIGDAKDTFPVPDDGTVKFINYTWVGDKSIWLNYGQERSGRFIGLTNSDGTVKTECGIHVTDADRIWDRDLWDEHTSSVMKLRTEDEVTAVINNNSTSIVVVYAPWCPFSQRMEDEYEKFGTTNTKNITVYSFRGDNDKRDYVIKNLNTKSFPTINIIKSNGDVIKYESEIRTVDAFEKFVQDNTN